MARTNPPKASRQNSKRQGENQETPGQDAKPIKKVDAAKAAINVGIESPQNAVAYIAKHYGIEMKPQHFSAIKSQLKKKLEEAQAAEESGLMPRVIEGYLAPPPKPRQTPGEPDLLDAVETIKTLIAELGTDKVKRIVELLG